MAIFHGKDALVTLFVPAFDANGRAVDNGPSTANTLGQALNWSLRTNQALSDVTAFGDEFRAGDAGLKGWDADIDLLWDAATASIRQDALFAAMGLTDFAASLFVVNRRLGICFFVEGETDGAKRVYYGTVIVSDARIVVQEADVVRLSVRMSGSDGLNYTNAAFAAGSFGALEQYTFTQLEAYTFTQLETLAEP